MMLPLDQSVGPFAAESRPGQFQPGNVALGEPVRKTVEFRSGRPHDRAGFVTGLTSAAHENGKKWPVAHGAWMEDRDSRFSGAVYYPDLNQGDIIPFFGHLFHVTETDGGGKTAWMEIEWLPPKDYPKGLTFQRGSFAIPVRTDNWRCGALHKSNVWIEEITAPKKEGQSPGARIAIHVIPVYTRDYKMPTVEVRAGDLLLIHKAQHKVRNIVARDEKQHIIGWVELDPEFTPVADEPKK
jgi:hypothetical protein